MSDQDYPEFKPAPSPLVEGERRKEQDRRQNDRKGKYDRRRNRCGLCLHFQDGESSEQGECLFHHLPMTADAFACPHFENVQSEQRK